MVITCILLSTVLFLGVSEPDEDLTGLKDGDLAAYHIADSKGNIVGRAIYEIDRTDNNLIDIKTRLERRDTGRKRIRILETAFTFDGSGNPLHLTTYFAYKDMGGKLISSHNEQITFRDGKAQYQVRVGDDLVSSDFVLPEDWFPFVSQELHSWVLAAALWKPDQKGSHILYPSRNELYTQRYYIRSSHSDFIQIGEKKYDCTVFSLSFQNSLWGGGIPGPPSQGKGSHIQLDARAASQSLEDVRRFERKAGMKNPFSRTAWEQVKELYFDHYAAGAPVPVSCKLYVKNGKLIAVVRDRSKILLNEDTAKVKTKYDFLEK